MSRRNTQQRRHRIVSLLQEQGELRVEDLAQTFNTSEVTIRKDLSALETSGLLLRRYGGAVPLPQDIVQDDLPGNVSFRKLAIAQAAATLVQDHYRIIVDSGRTTSAMLPFLGAKSGLVVMTNSLAIANALQELENEPTLLMTGGTWDSRSESFQGQLAEQVLRAYDFDQLFLGADGLDLARGTTTFNELYSLSRVMAEVAREVIVVAESSKLGRRIHNLELPWSEISTLVSDSDLPDEACRQLEKFGVRVVRAPLDNLLPVQPTEKT